MSGRAGDLQQYCTNKQDPVLLCPALAYPVPILPYAALPYPTLRYPILPYPIVPYPTLPDPTLPYPTLPYPTLPYPTLPCPTLYLDNEGVLVDFLADDGPDVVDVPLYEVTTVPPIDGQSPFQVHFGPCGQAFQVRPPQCLRRQAHLLPDVQNRWQKKINNNLDRWKFAADISRPTRAYVGRAK